MKSEEIAKTVTNAAIANISKILIDIARDAGESYEGVGGILAVEYSKIYKVALATLKQPAEKEKK